MADQLYIPTIPALGADNTVDLEQLGNAALDTFIRFDGIADGDLIYPNWRGCAADGSVHDFADNAVIVDMNLIEPAGMPVAISNLLLKELDQGWVFYSYTFGRNGVFSDESPRLFFYVGKRALVAGGLAVAQLRDAHDLCLDIDVITDQIVIVIAPYENMTLGDKVVLTWVGYTNAGAMREPYEVSVVLTQDHLDKPLVFLIPKAQAFLIRGGKAEVGYAVVYPDSARPKTNSPKQTTKIVAPTTALLPAIEIPGVTGFLDPGLYVDGLKLIINNYPLIQVGDCIVLYALPQVAGIDELLTLHVDPSIVDRGTFTFTVDADWLNTNAGLDVSFTYHYSRVGAEGASEPLTVNISKPRTLEAPNIQGATVEEPAVGSFNIKSAFHGIKTDVPLTVELVSTDSVHMRWDSGDDKGELLEPDDATNRVFTVPAQSVAPYMGKRLLVRYEIVPMGSAQALKSPDFDLGITDLKSSDFAAVSCTKPPSSGTLSIQAVKSAGGAEFTQSPWPFFFKGQPLRVTAVAGTSTYYLRGTATEGVAVTLDEFSAKKVIALLPDFFVENLAVGSNLSVYSEVSYDGGEGYKKFQGVNLNILA